MFLSNLINDLLRRARSGSRVAASADADRLWQQALALRAAGDAERARTAGEAMLERFPEDARAHYLLGLIRRDRNDPHGSLRHLDRAVALAPGWPDAHLAHGNVRWLLGDSRGAEESYRRAMALDIESVAPRCNLAFLLQSAGRKEESLELLRRAHEIAPVHPEVAWELVKALLDAGQPEAARAAAERTLAADATNPAGHKSLGLVHLSRHEPQAALDRFERAVALAPDDSDGWLNAGIAAQELGRLDEALAAYERALKLKPDHPPARWRRALVRLAKGEFDRGWSDYEARLASVSHPWRRFPQPLWQGEPLAGKTLLVHGEQGLGDEIMFASCLPELIAQAGHCVIDCHPRLAALFRRSFPAATVHGGWQTDDMSWLGDCPPADYQVPAGSVPRILRNRQEHFPHHAGYLRADAQRIAAWRARLVTLGDGLKVGLSWRGGTEVSRAHLRSLSLPDLLPVLRIQGVRFVDLQYTDTARERARLEEEHDVRLTHWPEALADFDETAALVAALDLTLSVCTAVVHLAGALGRPAWVMTPYSPEWRYGHAGEAMIWYPSVRLVRQPVNGAWQPVIAEIARRMERRARGGQA
jgi:tetratricopeptide (TPR) repeat protein